MKPELLELAAKLTHAREPFALVTVVRREAPSSAHVGDTALVTRNGTVHGWVGGGCTRSTLLREALRALADGQARLLSLSPEPAREARAGVTALQMTCQSGGTVDLYVEPVLPRSCLAIFGGTPAARALARISTAMGWQVDAFDPDGDATAWPEGVQVARDWASATLPPGAHVLVALMDERDADAIETAARLAPAYLGVIASKRRFAKLRERLLARGVPRATVDGIAAPAGLDIGARTPEEIALSVLAQIIALRTRVQAVAREGLSDFGETMRQRVQETPLQEIRAARIKAAAEDVTTQESAAKGAATKESAAKDSSAKDSSAVDTVEDTAPATPAARRSAAQGGEPVPQAAAGTLDEATDPVCGMTVAKTGALHFADTAGERFYFCCAGCRQMFLADPARYTRATPHGHG